MYKLIKVILENEQVKYSTDSLLEDSFQIMSQAGSANPKKYSLSTKPAYHTCDNESKPYDCIPFSHTPSGSKISKKT